MARWQTSLKKLLKAIPPPSNPRFVEGPILDPSLPELPEDHEALIRAYGSGEFEDHRIGCVIEIFNPRDPWHKKRLPKLHEILRSYRASEGDEYLPYPIYPDKAGVFVCGWNDSRDYWFWRMNESNNKKWPTIFYGDMQDAFEFEMPMVVFMQKLFFGEISRSDLNFAEPNFDPSGLTFEPSRRAESGPPTEAKEP